MGLTAECKAVHQIFKYNGPPTSVRRSPRTQMPLLGDKFRITTSLRVPLGLWQWPWLIKACLYSDRLWSNLTSGTPATAVRFGNRPAPSAGRHLTGQKGFRASPTHKAVGRDFFVASKQRSHLSPVCDTVGPSQSFLIRQMQDSYLDGW